MSGLLILGGGHGKVVADIPRPPRVLRHEGISQEGHVTMTEFVGPPPGPRTDP